MNVAARVQTAAEPGTVLVTAMTQRFITGTFDFEDRGDVEVKGKTEPLHLYRVLGLRAERAEQARARGRSGCRARSSAATQSCRRSLDTFEIVRAGSGRVAILLGEPGIGKSRLHGRVQDRDRRIRRRLDASAWIEGHCVSYGRTIPYHLVFDLVRSMLELPQTGIDVLPRDALDDRLQALLGADAADVTAYFAHLLAMPLTPGRAGPRSERPGSRFKVATWPPSRESFASSQNVSRSCSCSRTSTGPTRRQSRSSSGSCRFSTQASGAAAISPVVPKSDAPGWRLVGQATHGARRRSD